MNKEIFYPEIERLRGVACLLVLFEHITLTAPLLFMREILPLVLYNGRAGMPLFFVISGFIITTLLLKRLEQAQTPALFLERLGMAMIPLKNFFLRRFFRLMPLAFFNLLITAGVLFWAYDTDVLPYQTDWEMSFIRTGIEHLFCVYNLIIPQYLATEHLHYGGIGPYWSLSIEGQFYFLWPFVLVLLKTSSRQAIFALCMCCVGCVIARPAAEFWIEGTSYYHTLCNFDGLFLGSFLALLKTAYVPLPLANRGVRFIVPLLILLLWAYPGICGKNFNACEFIPILGSAGLLVWWASQNRNIVLGGRIIASSFEFIGKRSYAIYITQLITARFSQWIVEALGLFKTASGERSDFYSTGQFLVFFTILIVFVEFSHRCIEEPARRFVRKMTS
ncbi:MAG: acyltransferase [Holosporales bacterium]|jgi:peptidoglycan/LPS O-acetylase OafA/YrhL|nr:acyltransferase [Holosporales bacterium]